MADRTSAALFGKIFKILASPGEIDRKVIAREFYAMMGDYDFHDSQMDCDEALLELGLARKGMDPAYPEDGIVIIYKRDE